MALTQVKTSGIADDAVTLAKQAGGTDGQIITYDASGNPTAVGPGNDGQVLTSTGAGSPPAFETLPTQISLSNDANNRVITGTGSGLNGEANLTFDGNSLIHTVTANSHRIQMIAAGNHYTELRFDANRSSAGDYIGYIPFYWDGDAVADISCIAGADTTNKDDGHLIFRTSPSQGSIAERMRITSAGIVGINTSSPSATAISSNTVNGVLHIDSSGADSASVLKLGGKDGSSNSNYVQLGWAGAHNRFDITVNGNQALRVESDKDVTVVDGDLIIGTSGHGIDFAATGGPSNGSDSSELLDDYEEGEWAPTVTCATSGGYNLAASYNAMAYTKVGRQVSISGMISMTSESGTPNGYVKVSLPYSVADLTDGADFTILPGFMKVHGTNNVYNMCAIIQGVEASAFLAFDNGSGTMTWVTHGEVDTDWGLYMSGTYFTT